MTHPCVRHDSSMCATWLIHVCDMTHPCVRHDSSICATRLIHMCDMALSYVRHGSSICATCLIYMCSMTHPYVRHGSFICVTWLIQICDMPLFHLCDRTHPHRIWLIVQKDSSWPGAPLRAASDLCVILFYFWHAHTHTHSHKWLLWHDSSICPTCLICMCDIAHSHTEHDLLYRGTETELAHPAVRCS